MEFYVVHIADVKIRYTTIQGCDLMIYSAFEYRNTPQYEITFFRVIA
jgi:hypothetical protein